MNIDQAIAVIDDALSQLKLTRPEHVRLQVAVGMVQELVKVEKERSAAIKKANEEAKKTADEAKTPIDNVDRSQA